MTADQHKSLTVVSGLPRSGTSMVMRMLAHGGMPTLGDGVRAADDENPLGYFEHEAVKRLASDASWLADELGSAVKVIAPLLRSLPPELPCLVLMVVRDMDEVLASQAKMLASSGKAGASLPPAALKKVFAQQLSAARKLAHENRAWSLLEVQHADVIANPAAAAASINQFLGGGLDEGAMAAAVDARLYRNRAR